MPSKGDDAILRGLAEAGVELEVVGGTAAVLPPTRQQLLGKGQLNFETDLGKVDVLCELGPGEGYEQILEDTVVVGGIRVLGLARLIAVKARANRPKDRATLPVLIATLDERTRRRR
ncbi:MAG: hypothetical protein HY908_12260 [Myxococcales bacterium]|nr:hypothetical protein [Myxococcales bacterium]